MIDLATLNLVGVARIELATPAMSTQWVRAFTAVFCHFQGNCAMVKPRTSRESRLLSPEFHRDAEIARLTPVPEEHHND